MSYLSIINHLIASIDIDHQNRRWRPINSELRVNEGIRVKEVRVVSADGEQLGILPVKEALRIAREKDLDLVEVAPPLDRPSVKLWITVSTVMSRAGGKERARKRQKVVDIKEIRLTPKIETHDFQVKVKRALKFWRVVTRLRFPLDSGAGRLSTPTWGKTSYAALRGRSKRRLPWNGSRRLKEEI